MEVRTTFLDDLIGSYGFGKVHAPANHINSLYLALQQEDFSSFQEQLDTLLSGIPNELWNGATERFYHAIIHTAFTLMGTTIHSEESTRRGRADVIIDAAPYLYTIEFKLLRPTAAHLLNEADRNAAAEALADEALAQIATQGYLDPYKKGTLIPKPLAVVFDAQLRGVVKVKSSGK